jgi:hypothetical protein
VRKGKENVAAVSAGMRLSLNKFPWQTLSNKRRNEKKIIQGAQAMKSTLALTK